MTLNLARPIAVGAFLACAAMSGVMTLSVKSAEAANPRPLAQYGIDLWDAADGLPEMRIRAIVQSPDGYLWLGTANGLVRFDGVAFTVYNTQTGSLKDNEVGSLVEDGEGALWIGTYGGGLTRMKDGKFTTFTTADGLTDDYIRNADCSPMGDIWLATPHGVACFSKGKFITYSTKDGLPSNFISNISAQSPAGIFACSAGGLYRLEGGKFVLQAGAIDSNDGRMDTLSCAADGSLWMTFESSHVKRWQNGQLKTYTQADTLVSRPAAVYEDPQKDTWVGAYNGLSRLHEGRFDALPATEAAKLGVVLCVFVDREGSLWLGTEANGLARLRPVAVRTLTAEEGLTESSTRCVYRDSRGDIWIGAYMGFSRLSHGKITAYTRQDGNQLPAVTSIAEDAQGRIWIAAGGKITTFENDRLVPIPGWKNVFDVKVIARDSLGNMWAGTDGEGLFRIADGQITQFKMPDGLAGNQVRAILSDRHGALWVGTTTGVSRFQDGKFTNFKTADGLANDRVMSLFEDSDGTLWVGTRNGLSRAENGHFFNIRDTEGLPENYIYNVLEDGVGNFWMSGAKGIWNVPKAELNALAAGKLNRVNATLLGYRDGLRSASLVAGTQPNACQGDDGQLYFCSLKGLVGVRQMAQNVNHLIPPVVIEKVLIDKLEQPVNAEPQVPAGVGELEIHYTALSFVAPEKVHFKYRLDGVDTDWVDAGQRRFALYAHLPPGSYQFRVMACNNDGLWNEAGAAYDFRLPPHFYQTSWFYALIGLVITAFAGGAYVLKIHRMQKHEQELQRRVDEAVAQVKVLHGLLPICTGCKKIRDDQGYWNQIESYIGKHADIQFSHSLCPDCLRSIYPDVADEVLAEMKAKGVKGFEDKQGT